MAYTSGSPSAGQLEIGIALVLQDRFSNQAREASSVIRGLHRDAKNAVMANLTAMQSYAGSISGIAQRVISGLSVAVEQGSDFIDMMTTVGSISAASSEQMSGLSEMAQTLGMKTMFMSRDIASGMKYLAMAGNDANQIMDMIQGAAMMANATGMELGGKGGTADLLTNIMRTFKLESEQAANAVGDQLVKASMSSNVSMTDLAESIRYSAASMVTLKQQLPQVAAMIGTLGNAGIQGSMAGTSIRNMADYLTQSLTNPNFKGYKALARLGLSRADFIDANGDLLDFAIVLERINKASQGLTTLEQNAMYKSIFGVRGMRAAIAIMRDTEGYWDLLNKIQNESSGFTEEVVSKRMETIAGRIDIVKSALENLRTTFTTALQDNPIIMGILGILGKTVSLVRDLFASPVGPWLAGLGAILAIFIKIGSTVVTLRTRWQILNGDSQVSFRTMFKLLIGGWNSATLSAQQYLKMERAIIAQRDAGIMGNPGRAILSTGIPAGGVVKTHFGRYRDTTTGRFISKSAAEAAASAASPKSLTRTLMVDTGGINGVPASAARTAGNAAATTATTIAAASATRGALVSVGRGILGFGSKLIGFFGGPFGLAVTGISILAPMIYSALSRNKDAQEVNTKSVNTLADTIKASREGYKPVDRDSQEYIKEMRWLVKMLNTYVDEIHNRDSNIVNHFTLNLDGRKAIEEYINNREANLNVAAGVK